MSRFGRARRTLGSLLYDSAHALLRTSYRAFPTLQLIDKGYQDIAPAELGMGDLRIDSDHVMVSGQLKDIYERHLFVATCVNYLATRLASVPLRFYTTTTRDGADERERADDHEVARAFEWWNPEQSPMEAWETICSWWLLTGQAYVAKVESEDPRYAFELWPLFTPGVAPVKTTRGVVGYRYRVDGSEIQILAEDMIVFRSFSTTDRYSGMGRLHAGRNELITDLKARNWNDRLLEKGVHVSGVLETDEEMTPIKARKVRDSFEKDYAGASKAQRIMVLYGGLKFQPQTFAHRDIFWMEQLNMTKEDVAMALGIPMELLGQKSANHASLREKRRIFWEDTVKPIAARFDSTMTGTFLQRHSPELEVEHDFSGVEALQPDRQAIVKTGKEAVSSGLYTINEYRREFLDLEPVENGDTILVGRGVIPLEAALREASQETTQELRLKTVSKAESRYVRQMTELQKSTEVHLQNVVRRASRKMEGAVVSAVKESGGRETLKAVDTILFSEGSETMVASTKKELATAMEKAGTAANGAIGLESAFSIRNTAAERRLAAQGGSIKGTIRTTATKLREELAQGIAAGDTEQQLSSRVRTFFRGDRANALTIARTETSRAINWASRQSIIDAKRKHGIIPKMEWRASQDGSVREAHAAANGQSIYPDKELFVVGGDHLAYPGDRSGQPENTINCRCIMVPRVQARPPEPIRADYKPGEGVEPGYLVNEEYEEFAGSGGEIDWNPRQLAASVDLHGGNGNGDES